MRYSVLLTAHAARDLSKLPKDVRKRVTDALERLSDDPRPHGCEKISGTDEWRIRVGDYRIRYTIDDKGKVVIVTRIGHRKKIYEG